MNLTKARESRKKSSINTTKRILYTKGDSQVEDSDSAVSPKKQQRLSQTVGNISIVPPPPVYLRHSQSIVDHRPDSNSLTENDVCPAPRDFEDRHTTSAQQNTLQIASPPPEYVDSTPQKVSVGRKSNKRATISPLQATQDSGHRDVCEETRAANVTERQSIGVIPPPPEYNHSNADPESPVCEHSKSANMSNAKTKSSSKRNLTKRKASKSRISVDHDMEEPISSKPNRSRVESSDVRDDCSDNMEALRMCTPTPPTVQETSSALAANQKEPDPSTVLEDGPSTSYAARQALEKSMVTSTKNSEKNASNDDVFKKPLAPAPRAKSKKKTKSEVEKLVSKLHVTLQAVDHDASGELKNLVKWKRL